MINHDPNNPRTKNYTIIKSILRNIEFITKNFFYFFVVFINCIIFRPKKNYLNLGNYEDTRYINYLGLIFFVVVWVVYHFFNLYI